MVILEVAGRKQLILTNIRHEHCIIRSLLSNGIHYLAHQQRTLLGMDCRFYYLLTFHLIKRLKRVAPLLMFILIYQGRDSGQRLLTVANHRHIGLHILINLTMVNIQMNNLRLFSVGLQITSHTVAESHTDSNQHITLLLLQVHSVIAMHTQHAHVERMIRGKSRESEHRTTCGNIGFLQEGLQFCLGISQFHTLPYERQRFLSMIDQFSSLTHGLSIQLRIRHV